MREEGEKNEGGRELGKTEWQATMSGRQRKKGKRREATSGWSMAAGVRSSTMLVVTVMAVTSSSGTLAVMLTKTAAVCSLSEPSCCKDA